MKQEFVSIIIPTLNEAKHLGNLLPALRRMDNELEIIVADGGSVDATASQIGPGVKWMAARRGRGSQMNAGAAAASGKVLWFIHADCLPHPDSVEAIRQALQNPRVAGGAFTYRHNHPAFIYRISDFCSNLKNRLFGQFYGEMGIFVRREIFLRMGGFREWPLMEDADFCRRLKRQGKVVLLPKPMEVSARRWENEGRLRNILRNWALLTAWRVGINPRLLARYYHFGNLDERKTKYDQNQKDILNVN